MAGQGERRGEKNATGPALILNRPAPTRRQLLLGGGHLAALWALAFVLPLLDLLGRNPDFFVARDNTAGDILILAIGFTLVPPVILLAIEWLVSKLSSKAYYGLHFLLMAGIAGIIFIGPVADLLGGRSSVILLLSFAIGCLFAWTVVRFVFAKNLVDILILAPLVILALFIFGSKTSDLIFPKGDGFELASNSGDDVPVVILLFDELGTSNLMGPDGEIAADRYPNFARLAKQTTWYKNFTTTAFTTTIAVPGMLTGNDPASELLPTWQDQPRSLFSQFARDRDLHVLEPVTALCPEDVCVDPSGKPGQISRLKALYSYLKYVEGRLLLPPGLADRLPDVGSNFEGFGEGNETAGDPAADQTPKNQRLGDRAVKPQQSSDPGLYQQLIREIPDSNRGLTLLHMHMPHQIWKYDPRGLTYNFTPIMQLSKSTGNWLVNSNGITTAQERMYTQTGFADRLVGQMRQQLASMDLWDEAMVIVTADHGISFEGDGVPQRMADTRAMGEVANPPLFIKYPGQREGGPSAKHALTLDLVPTIARELGVDDLYETEGVPLQGPVPERDVTIRNVKGKSFTVTLEEMIRQRRAALGRASRRLGDGPFYTFGPAPELLGQKVDPVPPGTSTVSLDSPGIFRGYQPGTTPVPMFVTGTWNGDLPQNPDAAPVFAIAVNGRIEATTRPFALEGTNRWGALVNPDSLRRNNAIGIYEVRGSELVPLGGN